MNPSVDPFQPGTTPPGDLRNVNQSLCKALADERQAHRATKQALLDEVEKCLQSEHEVRSLLKTNNSLAAAAHMLGGIVKHNINNPNSSERDQVRDPCPSQHSWGTRTMTLKKSW